MEPFNSHRGLIAAMDRANVDTDQIIPKQFLKSIKRTGFGENLFFDWRYLADGQPDPAFELNDPRFTGASILVTRNNFGCGSSREHAVWAVLQDGYKVVIAPLAKRQDTTIPAFADIFRNNATKNGLLTVELDEADIDQIFGWIAQYDGLEVTADLEQQRISVHCPDAEAACFPFEIDAAAKEQLIHGLDPINLTLTKKNAIAAFEAKHDTQLIRK
jgi:3-isopropylmalate/(R)-2-methylmalate dehydratase small subunit